MTLCDIDTIVAVKATIRGLICKNACRIFVHNSTYIHAAGTPDNRINCGNILHEAVEVVSRCSY